MSKASVRLAQLKKSQKETEAQKQMLQSRVNYLLQEKKRISKSLEKTQKRIAEVNYFKLIHEEKRFEKSFHSEAKAKALEDQRRKNKDFKETLEKNKSSVRNWFENQKVLKANKLKQEKELQEQKIIKDSQEMMFLKEYKANQIRKYKVFAFEKMAEKKNRVLQDNRKTFKEKIQNEVKLRETKLKEHKELEQLEAELIKKLENTQQIQKQAYENLNAVFEGSEHLSSKTPTEEGSNYTSFYSSALLGTQINLSFNGNNS